jgi:hypothetical protein
VAVDNTAGGVEHLAQRPVNFLSRNFLTRDNRRRFVDDIMAGSSVIRQSKTILTRGPVCATWASDLDRWCHRGDGCLTESFAQW